MRVSGDDNLDKHFEFTHKPIASIQDGANLSGPNGQDPGYYGTRLVVTWGYQDFIGVITAFRGSNTQPTGAELRASIKLSTKGIGAKNHGSVHYQQGQLSG